MPCLSIDHLPEDRLVNTRRRIEFQEKSCLYRFSHPVEKMVIDYEFYTEVLSYFDKTFQIHDLEHTARMWDFVLKSHNISWKKEDDLTTEKFKQIYQAFKEAVVYTGSGIDCPLCGEGDIHHVTEFLFAKEERIPLSFFNWKNIKNIIFSTDLDFLAEFRGKLEEALKVGFETFQKGGVNEELFKGFVYNIVALVPYTYPVVGQTLSIPMKYNGTWKMVEYRVDKKFELSPSWFSSPLPSYGLVSVEGPPIISCLGTTYPAGEGFIATLLSDFTPGFSPGHAASLWGLDAVEKWLEGKENVHLTGMSLGGAISLHLSRLHTQSISEVRAFNPPGQYPWSWSGIDHSHIDYHIYSNDNDLVSTLGMFPTGDNVNVYRVLSHEQEDLFSSHAKVYHAAEHVTLIRTSAEYENSRIERILLTTLHMLFSWVIFFTVLPFALIYRLCEFLYQLISGLCYTRTEKGEVTDAKLLGSSPEHDQLSSPESSITAQS